MYTISHPNRYYYLTPSHYVLCSYVYIHIYVQASTVLNMNNNNSFLHLATKNAARHIRKHAHIEL